MTRRYIPSAARTASSVARPTSRLFFARAETTTAPSTPINTHSVISMVFLTCSHTGIPSSTPVKSSVKVSSLNIMIASTINAPSGNSFARVATRLMLAAVCTPRRMRKWTIQSRTEAPTIACQVLPSPNRRSAGVSVKKLSAEKTITK
ncbi:Uncharacterised protein [Salmonella enterica subsp. enterica serovar Bovismorbificans]|uniref:Uncharacterized protein n=1 Tax=Salmonella enterica subsp. enterica serovar Bovismorbificans TaxID=58097 RepID=A0A655E4X6_SALET|nr:Uncharacterised protein [Salmonella enterica subsp. enterica serovar Bovismorbificans]